MMGSTAPLFPAQSSRMPILRRTSFSTLHLKPRIQPWRSSALTVAALCFAFALFLPVAAAAAAHGLESPAPVAVTQPFEPEETLIIDSRMPIMDNGRWSFVAEDDIIEESLEEELRRRANAGSTATTAMTATAAATTVTTAASKTTTASALPSPFDSSLASNFSTGAACPTFINSFLTSHTFKQCYPFSMLMQGSRSFFEAEKSLVSITRVLDASCAANSTFCASYLTHLAANLTDSANCGDDFALGNSIVVQAYLGMIAYLPLYTTTCLKDPDSDMYCFANAVNNVTTPANVYFYYLPLNVTLPASSLPSCNWCLEQTMAVYHSASADRTQPIANTYKYAAEQVDSVCGSSFVNDTLPAATTSGAFGNTAPPWLLASIILALTTQLLLN